MYTHRFAIALACVFFFLFQTIMTAHPVSENVGESADSPVNIPDAALRHAFEVALKKSAGDDITQAEMATVTRLIAKRDGVSDLTGLAYATQLTTLRLGGNPIADLSQLETLTQLQILDMPNCWITDISPLRGLNRLSQVNLQNNMISDASPLLRLPALMRLELNGNAIRDASAFQEATAPLILLALTDNQIVDVSPLAAFTRNAGTLRILTLHGNPATDFSSFSGLTLYYYDFDIPAESTEESIDIPDPIFRKAILRALNKAVDASLTASDLEELEALSTGGTDFTGLEHAVNLKNLRILNSGLSDVGPLTTKLVNHLTGLEALAIRGNQYNHGSLVDISPLSKLSQLTNLEKLDLSYNQIVDISPLKGLTQLKRLLLTSNQIVDVSPLAPLVAQLQCLDLYDNRISDFSSIATDMSQDNGEILDSARYSGINNNGQNLHLNVPPDNVVNIPDAGLRAALEAALGKESGASILRSEMETLTTLDASDRGIRSLAGLWYATGLTALNLTDNAITDAWSLRDLTQLIRLELAGNKLTGANLSTLTQLQHFDISRNLVASVNTLPLKTLSSLTTLNVSGNHIADISPLATLTHLNALYLSENPDTDYSAFATLLPTLDAADFSYQAPEAEAQQSASADDTVQGIVIPDANLRAVIEAALGKTSGETITQAEMETLRRLNARRAGIQDLTGLEYAINLQRLNLERNKISDVSPLAGLTQLKRLYLNRNRISDFSPIATVTEGLSKYRNGKQKAQQQQQSQTVVVNADVDRNGIVDATDLDIVSRYEGLALDSVESGLYPDVNGDGTIDTEDVLAVTELLGGE